MFGEKAEIKQNVYFKKDWELKAAIFHPSTDPSIQP